jgi:hypothetical protein
VLRLTGAERGDRRGRPGPLRSGLVSITCLLRGVPLFFSTAPRTPLRTLCIVALDTIHVLRHSQPLSRQRRQELATFLDFQACTNALWDRKTLCAEEYQAQRQYLENAGLGPWIAEYVVRLRELETRRPQVGGDRRRFDAVRSYREAVARLSLATITAIALDAEDLDEGIRATHDDGDVAALFRMAMQCQIIDDVVDYEEDLAAALPSFLTASASLPQALSWTAEAARRYALVPAHSAGRSVLPLRVAVHLLTMVTKVVIAVAGRGEARVSGG